ncbi:MAG TPA: DUF3137 domain-containing protein, partial [Bacteroidia bacterium]|nr:DUF3137 domain-containing protein [Bacteroidia bacterium]
AGGSDYVEGQLGETYIQFSKILTSDKNFSGIFMIVGFNKYFNGSYYIIPRKYATGLLMFSKVMNEMYNDVPKIIDLENPNFEQEYAVFGSDSIEARYILTPLFMDKMLQFSEEVKNDIYVSFTRSRMFLAFGTKSNDIFEPSLTEETTLQDIKEWSKALQSAIGIVDEFGLNTRIWSKK